MATKLEKVLAALKPFASLDISSFTEKQDEQTLYPDKSRRNLLDGDGEFLYYLNQTGITVKDVRRARALYERLTGETLSAKVSEDAAERKRERARARRLRRREKAERLGIR